MAGQPGPLTAHPVFELADQRRNAGRAHRQARLCGQSVDLALDREDRVDLAYGLRHRDFGHLEDHVASVAHYPRADLDQLLAQAGQPP